MAHYRKLDWTQPDGEEGSFYAVTPSTSTGGMSIIREEGQWWASWDLALPGEDDPEPLMEAGQKVHEAWLSAFLDPEAEEKGAAQRRDGVAIAHDWLAGRIKRLRDYGEGKGIWSEIAEVMQIEVDFGADPMPYELRLANARMKASEAEKQADKQRRKARDLRRRVNELEERIEAAVIAVSDTAPSWKHHLYAVMAALGRDFGDPDWELPNQRKRSDALQARLNEAEARLMGMHALREALEECRRLSQGGTHDVIGTLRQVEAAANLGIENCSLMEYPLVVNVAVHALSWVREDRDDVKFPCYQAFDPVYGTTAFRITQVDESGMCFMVANGKFSKHPDLQDAKVCAEQVSRQAVQDALLPHIRVRSARELEAEARRASKAAMAAAHHSKALKDAPAELLAERQRDVEDLLTTLRHGWPIDAEVDRAMVRVGGPIACQLRQAVHSHDLGSAYDVLKGRLLDDGWKMLEFEDTSETEGWVCRLLSPHGQEVCSEAGADRAQEIPAHAMVIAMLWGMRLDIRRSLGEVDDLEAVA